MANEAVMLVGFPASGKGTVAQELINKGYLHLNRDKVGGRTLDLLGPLEDALRNGKDAVLDNTNMQAEKRAHFIKVAKRVGVPIRCMWVSTPVEDCSINALMRMWDRYGKLFLQPSDFKEVPDDPNMFPITVLFKMKKDFEKPSTAEGFSKVERVDFSRKWPKELTNKAVIVDYDQTVRDVQQGAPYKFPTKTSEIKVLPNRAWILKRFKNDGYLLLGASNQSGVSRGQVSKEAVDECFRHTNKLLGLQIQVVWCPHSVPPSCYCRKPQSGLGVQLIRQYKLDPTKTIYVGDQTTDKTFASRLGFTYHDAEEFFK